MSCMCNIYYSYTYIHMLESQHSNIDPITCDNGMCSACNFVLGESRIQGRIISFQ